MDPLEPAAGIKPRDVRTRAFGYALRAVKLHRHWQKLIETLFFKHDL